MSDFFKWDKSVYGIGVTTMDGEHEVLIGKMNALHQKHAAGASAQEIQPLLDGFVAFTLKHFADEEAHMAKVGYTGLESHKTIHKRLLGEVQQHVAKFQTTGRLDDAFFHFLSFWLKSHILGVDKKYAGG